MMLKRLSNITLLTGLVALLVFSSCRKFEQFPDEPIISYDGFLLENDLETGITYRGVLVLRYQDGNGDIGLESWDTLPPFNYGSKYYYNLVIKYFEMQHGEWEEVDFRPGEAGPGWAEWPQGPRQARCC